MKTKKYVTLAIASTIGFSFISEASAATIKPSLQSQMQYQSAVDKDYISWKIQADNANALRLIRERNAEKISSLQDSDDTEEFYSAPVKNTNVKTFSSPIIDSIKTPTKKEESKYTSRQVGNIDMNRVEQAWLGWVNGARAEKGLDPYITNDNLSDTAQEWAEFSRDRGYTTHGRPGDGCTGATNYGCYNYAAIDEWFKDRGVYATNVNRSTHTENVGYGSFQCKDADCTDEAIAAIKKTYNFFYNEKSYNGVHYRTMVNPNFTQL